MPDASRSQHGGNIRFQKTGGEHLNLYSDLSGFPSSVSTAINGCRSSTKQRPAQDRWDRSSPGGRATPSLSLFGSGNCSKGGGLVLPEVVEWKGTYRFLPPAGFRRFLSCCAWEPSSSAGIWSAARKFLHLQENHSDHGRRASHQSSKRVHDGELKNHHLIPAPFRFSSLHRKHRLSDLSPLAAWLLRGERGNPRANEVVKSV